MDGEMDTKIRVGTIVISQSTGEVNCFYFSSMGYPANKACNYNAHATPNSDR